MIVVGWWTEPWKCLLWVVISSGRRNTLTKMQKMAYRLMNQKRRRDLYGGRESGAVGPLDNDIIRKRAYTANVISTLSTCLNYPNRRDQRRLIQKRRTAILRDS